MAVINLDDPSDVAAWNCRAPAPASQPVAAPAGPFPVASKSHGAWDGIENVLAMPDGTDIYTASQVQAMLAAAPSGPKLEPVDKSPNLQGQAVDKSPEMQGCGLAREPLSDECETVLSFLAGLHPCLTIDGPPMAVAERIFDAVLAERAELLEQIKRMKGNLETMRQMLRTAKTGARHDAT